MQPRAFVGAVLTPHHAENPQFGVAGLASEDPDDFFVFGGRQLVLRDEIRCNQRCAHARTTACRSDWKTTRPSFDPRRGSAARSGCGIIPMTLRSWFSTPAM